MKRSICMVLAWLLAASFAVAKPTYKVTKDDVMKLSPEVREVFAGLQYLLNAHQMRQFLGLTGRAEREEWLRIFWQMSDPTPTTPENEMKDEHEIRVRLARRYFGSRKWPGWDKRGEVFIRYGVPEYRGKIYGEVRLSGVQPPGELWYYRRHNMLISFENFSLSGEYIYAIDALGASESMSKNMMEYVLYDTTEPLAKSKKIPQNFLEKSAAPEAPDPMEAEQFNDPVREQAYYETRRTPINDDIDAVLDPDRLEILPKDVAAVFERDQVRKIANNFEIVLEETPSSYPYQFEDKSLTFYFGVDQFRGGENSNRVEVQVEVPVVVEGAMEETFHVEAVVWDSQFNEVARRQRNIELRTGPEVTAWQNLLPTQMVFSLRGGYYRMGISVTGKNSGLGSSYRTTLVCEPFGKAVALSDILFARRIGEAGQPSMFMKGALEIIPHPLRAYTREYVLPVYFESYNLSLDANGVSSYTIEYKIIPHSREKSRFWDRFRGTTPVVSSKFQGSGFGRNDVHHLSIRTENLQKGSYDFLITITDDLTGAIAYKKGTFSLVN